jgi:hypothetical protein
LTTIQREGDGFRLDAPFAARDFTVEFRAEQNYFPVVKIDGQQIPLERVEEPLKLRSGRWLANGQNITVCYDLPRGRSEIVLKG